MSLLVKKYNFAPASGDHSKYFTQELVKIPRANRIFQKVSVQGLAACTICSDFINLIIVISV